jgi:aminoglycoside/choline kinase family phosphotransferase
MDALSFLLQAVRSLARIGVGRLGRRAGGGGSDVPSRLTEITPTWLSRALQSQSPGVEVRSVERLDDHSGTTTRARFRMTYARADADATLPATIFVKIAPIGIKQRVFVDLAGLGRTEVSFYNQIRSAVPVRAPRAYVARSAASGIDFVLLLEDLAASGCRVSDVRRGCGLEEAQAVVTELAKLHAAFSESPRFAADLNWVASRENRRRRMGWERFVSGQLMQLAAKRFGRKMPEEFSRACVLVRRRREHLEDLWAGGPQTLVHGDPHLGNLFFDADRVGFLDWQVIQRAPGMKDVSYFLCNSLRTELRRAHERDLIRHYLETLAALGVPPATFDETWHQHRIFALYSWLAATFTAAASGLQDADIAMAGMRTVF